MKGCNVIQCSHISNTLTKTWTTLLPCFASSETPKVQERISERELARAHIHYVTTVFLHLVKENLQGKFRSKEKAYVTSSIELLGEKGTVVVFISDIYNHQLNPKILCELKQFMCCEFKGTRVEYDTCTRAAPTARGRTGYEKTSAEDVIENEADSCKYSATSC